MKSCTIAIFLILGIVVISGKLLASDDQDAKVATEFKNFFMEALEKSDKSNKESNGFFVTESSYDVQKTNSLVSPYIGIVKGILVIPKAKKELFELKLYYAYQNGKWLLNKEIYKLYYTYNRFPGFKKDTLAWYSIWKP